MGKGSDREKATAHLTKLWSLSSSQRLIDEPSAPARPKMTPGDEKHPEHRTRWSSPSGSGSDAARGPRHDMVCSLTTVSLNPCWQDDLWWWNLRIWWLRVKTQCAAICWYSVWMRLCMSCMCMRATEFIRLDFLHPRNQSSWTFSDLWHPGVAATKGQMNKSIKLPKKSKSQVCPQFYDFYIILTPVWCELIW